MSFTDYLEEELLDHVFGSGTYSKPGGRHIALFTSAPGEGGGGTEVSGNGYSRVSAAAFSITAGDPSRARNSEAIEFPAATAPWGTVTHTAVFDAASGGNMLAYAELDEAKSVGTADVLRFLTNELEYTLD